jgi:hypothetical protein
MLKRLATGNLARKGNDEGDKHDTFGQHAFFRRSAGCLGCHHNRLRRRRAVSSLCRV